MYLGLRKSQGCTNELGSLTQDDSKLTLTVTLKDAATKKRGLGWQDTPKANTTLPSRSEIQLYNIKTMEYTKTRI